MNRRGFMKVSAAAGVAGTAFGTLVNAFRVERDKVRSAEVKTGGVSVLDRIRRDPTLVMRLAGYEPDPWQEGVLRSGSPRLMLLCARQTGKSLVVAAVALLTVLLRPDALVVVISRSEDQSRELYRKIVDLYEKLLRAGLDVKRANSMLSELHLENGSRIVPKPCNPATLVGYTATLLVLDEGAKIPDLVYRSVRPLLAVTGGRLIALSTPFGKRGWFWSEWSGFDENGQPTPTEQWEKVGPVVATQCPRIPAEFLRHERASLGDRWYRQEYLCSFEAETGSLFRDEDVRAMLDPSIKGLFEPGEDPFGRPARPSLLGQVMDGSVKGLEAAF